MLLDTAPVVASELFASFTPAEKTHIDALVRHVKELQTDAMVLYERGRNREAVERLELSESLEWALRDLADARAVRAVKKQEDL